ncbi:MAG: ribosome biogenesis GTP-binding protein YihA/YsxC, partial [Clostridia bacterium]|nr:ribosome biogenesis GTP-binding protein YihA/YsxC [Clostridia bacterium]
GAARVSKTPGRTRLINTFLIEDSFYLIDLPGYGYAKASKKEQEEWGKTIPDYITNSPNLKLALVLTDFRIPPQQSDAAMCAFLRAQGIPHTVVATKADGLPKGKWHKQKLDLAFACKLTFAEDICVTSAKSGHGIDALVKKLKGII